MMRKLANAAIIALVAFLLIVIAQVVHYYQPSWFPEQAVNIWRIIVLCVVGVIGVIACAWYLSRFYKQYRKERAEEIATATYQSRVSIREICDRSHRVLRGSSWWGRRLELDRRARYLLLGALEEGKTTLIRRANIGLRPVFSDDNDEIEPTRGCSWFFANNAVVIDTAGKFTTFEKTDEVEAAAWEQLLVSIRKSRPWMPLNGIVYAVSCRSLLDLDDAQLRDLAKRYQRRLENIRRHVRVRVPVYVVLTKCDHIPGFTEFFSGLEDTGQAWGYIENSRSKGALKVRKAVRAQLDQLVESAEAFMLGRINELKDVSERQRAHGFIQAFSDLQPRIELFVGEVFDSDRLEAPFLRGVFFTSALPESHARSERLAKAAARYNSSLPLPPRSKRSLPPLFARDVFTRSIFPDRGLARLAVPELKRQRVVNVVASSALALTAFTVTCLPYRSYDKNYELLEKIGTSVRSIETERVGEQCETRGWGELRDGNACKYQSPISIRSLTELLQLYSMLSSFENEWFGSSGHHMGMYQGHKLYSTSERILGETIHDRVLFPALCEVRRSLNDIRNENSSMRLREADLNRALELLQVYLLLTTPNVDKDNYWWSEDSRRKILVNWVANYWAAQKNELDCFSDSATSGDSDSARICTALREHFTAGDSGAAYHSESTAFIRDTDLVADVRRIINKSDYDETWLALKVDEINRKGEIVRFTDLMPRALQGVADTDQAILLSDAEEIPFAYTREGWQEHMCPALTERTSQRVDWLEWVSDRAETEQQNENEEYKAILRARHLKNHRRIWLNYINGLQIRLPSEFQYDVAFGVIQALVQQDAEERAAITIALRTARENVDLFCSDAEPDQEGEKDAKLPCGCGLLYEAQFEEEWELFDREFGSFVQFIDNKDSDFGAYVSGIDRLYKSLLKLQDSPADSAIKEAVGTEAGSTLLALQLDLGKKFEPVWKSRLSSLLEPPLKRLKDLYTEGELSGQNRDWCNEVYRQYATISGRFPFGAGADVSTDEVAKFFGPNGALWTYYETRLKDRVIELGRDRYRLLPGVSGRYNGQVARFLNAAETLKTALFEDEDLAVNFTVRVHPSSSVSDVYFEFNDQKAHGDAVGSPAIDMLWPGKGRNAKLRVTGGIKQEVESRGSRWSLFKLLLKPDLKVTRSEGRVLELEWVLRQPRPKSDEIIRIELESNEEVHPFFNKRGLLGPLTDERLQRVPPLIKNMSCESQ